jgi:hypothetical protein
LMCPAALRSLADSMDAAATGGSELHNDVGGSPASPAAWRGGAAAAPIFVPSGETDRLPAALPARDSRASAGPANDGGGAEAARLDVAVRPAPPGLPSSAGGAVSEPLPSSDRQTGGGAAADPCAGDVDGVDWLHGARSLSVSTDLTDRLAAWRASGGLQRLPPTGSTKQLAAVTARGVPEYCSAIVALIKVQRAQRGEFANVASA